MSFGPEVREIASAIPCILHHVVFRMTMGLGVALLVGLCVGCSAGANVANKDEASLTGKERPRQIPKDWIGEPLPGGKGWRWLDPKDRGNSVRIYRGDPNAENPVDRDTYVVVTVKGELIDRQGKPMGEYLRD